MQYLKIALLLLETVHAFFSCSFVKFRKKKKSGQVCWLFFFRVSLKFLRIIRPAATDRSGSHGFPGFRVPGFPDGYAYDLQELLGSRILMPRVTRKSGQRVLMLLSFHLVRNLGLGYPSYPVRQWVDRYVIHTITKSTPGRALVTNSSCMRYLQAYQQVGCF